MVNLCIWTKGILEQGHAGMQVGSEYITWIPDMSGCHLDFHNPQSYQTHFPAKKGITLHEDLKRNNRMPEFYYSLYGLDEESILQWWGRWKADSSLKWNYKESSCMTVVTMALNAGLQKRHPQLQISQPEGRVITWLQMKKIAEDILRKTG